TTSDPCAVCARAFSIRFRSASAIATRFPVTTTECSAPVSAIVDPDTELEFLQNLPVELMWGVGPVTKACLAEVGVLTIGQLAKTQAGALERLLGSAAGEKLAALAWNRDPREIRTQRRARSAGAQAAIGRTPA